MPTLTAWGAQGGGLWPCEGGTFNQRDAPARCFFQHSRARMHAQQSIATAPMATWHGTGGGEVKKRALTPLGRGDDTRSAGPAMPQGEGGG